MNKKELASIVAEKASIGVGDTNKVIESTFGVIKETLGKGEKVEISGFGSFEAKLREARTGRNPQTGEVIQIPASVAPSFKAGKAFKDYLKERTATFMKK